MKLLYLVIFNLILSCSFKNTNNNIKIKSYGAEIPDTVIYQIKKHYDSIFGNDYRIEEYDYLTRLSFIYTPKISTDTSIEINIPKKIFDSENYYTSNRLLFGDLNNDNKKDIVVTVNEHLNPVHTLTDIQTLFIFFNIDGKYKVRFIANETNLSECKGYFKAKSIENKCLSGFALCCKPEYPCKSPTLKYAIQIDFSGQKPVTKSSKKIE